MTDSALFLELCVDQVGNELAGSHQYIGAAIYFNMQNMPQTAKVFYDHAVEERNHAMRFVQYLIDRNHRYTYLPAVEQQAVGYRNTRSVLESAVSREKQVTAQIINLAQTAHDNQDFLAQSFITWFLREQIEEEKLFTTLLQKWDQTTDPSTFEDFIARDIETNHAPGAYPVAGGTL